MVPQRPLAWSLVVAAALLVGAGALPGHAQQPTAIPERPNAELLFDEGVAAFEDGRYEAAAERFRLAAEYPLHRKTTAALMMSGKALLQLQRPAEAIDRLSVLLAEYPETSYRAQAEALLEQARLQQDAAAQAQDTLRVGVTLPMGGAQAPLSQALFNGLRLAVDGHNGLRRRYIPPRGLAPADTFRVYDTAAVHSDSLADTDGSTTVATPTDTVRVDSLRIVTEKTRRPSWVAKMYFRATGATPQSAAAAVDSLVRLDGVDVVVGPIRSAAAEPAGRRAEAAGVPLLAPIATDPSVSKGRTHVFQANPTIPDRGRIMARVAAQGLLLDRVGVVFERGSRLSTQMARGFREAARQYGLEVPLSLPLRGARDWSRLPTLIEEDSTLTDSLLSRAEALYLPVSGRGAAGKIQGALTGLRQVVPSARVLGNAEWHDLPFMEAASAATATYTNGFHVPMRRPASRRFVRQYRLLTGSPPDELSPDGRRLAYTGYDVARFLLRTAGGSAQVTSRALRTAPPYEGVGMRIGFKGQNANQLLFVHRYRDQQVERLR